MWIERGQLSLHHCFSFSILWISSSREGGRFIFLSFALTDHNIGSAQEGVNSCMKAGINKGLKEDRKKPVLSLEMCKMKLHVPQSWRFADVPEVSQRHSVYVYMSHAQKTVSWLQQKNPTGEKFQHFYIFFFSL